MFADIHTIVFDFDGVFTDNKVYVSETGLELVRCDRGDGLAIGMLKTTLKDKDIDVFILSTEKNPVVMARAKKLNLQCIQGSSDKLSTLKSRLDSRFGNSQDNFKGVIYIGNDINDLEVMKVSGYSFAPSDAHASIKKVSTKVLSKNGGEAFVREFIEDYFIPYFGNEMTNKSSLILTEEKT